MRAYLFDSFNRYTRFSRELDAQTILCNKSWWLFNNSGEKELYIFNTDGSLIISISGKVTNATWRFITANSSIIITVNNQSYMVHPAFYDDTIFALKVDGTEKYAFFIDENKLPSTNLRTLNDLIIYFQEIERQAILAEEQKKQAEIEAENQRKIQEELEKQQRERERKEDEKASDNLCSLFLKGLIIFHNWYFVPIVIKFLSLKILGISEQSFVSYPYIELIILSAEVILAVLMILNKSGKSWMWFCLLCVNFILLLVLLYFM